MGYTTHFKKKIKIEPELTASQIKFIKSIYGDMRDFNPSKAEQMGFTWFRWELNEDMNALQWDGGEKFYDAPEKMQYIINECLLKWDNLKFNGTIRAQGEETEDIWDLKVVDNVVTVVEYERQGETIECPDCEHEFRLGKLVVKK